MLSVCNLVSFEFPEGVVSVLSMSYFSHKGDSGGGSREGEGYLELTVASLGSPG